MDSGVNFVWGVPETEQPYVRTILRDRRVQGHVRRVEGHLMASES
jgi:hypothetical protein